MHAIHVFIQQIFSAAEKAPPPPLPLPPTMLSGRSHSGRIVLTIFSTNCGFVSDFEAVRIRVKIFLNFVFDSTVCQNLE
jgi:hypothetical protein